MHNIPIIDTSTCNHILNPWDSKENKHIVITGDFNYDLLKHNDNKDVNDFITLMYENLCQPCISQPTRIVNNQNPTLLITFLLTL